MPVAGFGGHESQPSGPLFAQVRELALAAFKERRGLAIGGEVMIHESGELCRLLAQTLVLPQAMLGGATGFRSR